MHRFLKGWGERLYRVRWAIVIVWIALALAGGLAYGKLPALLSGGGWDIPGSQSKAAGELLSTQFAGRSETSMTLVLRDPDNAAGTPAYNEKLKQVTDRLKAEEGVSDVFSILDASEAVRPALLGKDPNMSIAFVDSDLKPDFVVNKIPEYQELLADESEKLGVETSLVGTAAFWSESSIQSQEGLAKAEMIVFPLVIVILLLVFRSIVATLTPLIVTIASLLVAMGIVYLVAEQIELSVFVTNSAMMLGLGVGIDYSLFLVSRFKQELERNKGNLPATLAKTLETAGHTVFFSAITVIAALSALFVVPIAAIKAIAFGGVAVVFVAGIASLTLLPAVLGILGPRINKGTLPFLKPSASRGAKTSAWKRWTHAIMRRPALFLVLALGALAAAAVPATDLKLSSPDMRILPADTPVRQGFSVLENSQGVGSGNPVQIVLHQESGDWSTPEALGQLAALHAELAEQPHVSGVGSALAFFPGMEPGALAGLLQAGLPADVDRMVGRYLSDDRRTALLEVQIDQYGSSDISKNIVKQWRDVLLPGASLPAGTEFHIGGETMAGMETSDAINDSLLPSLGIMLALLFLILMFTFRSLVLPIKAMVLNLFSVAATYGILVLVFALGYGAEIFDVETNGYIIHFVPVLLLALLFGLSTDYEVFLVSRIKEEYERTGNHDDSIAEGMKETGPLITGAAVLMVAVFAGFSFSGVLPIQMLGFGMAVAIALDSTIIRMLLVPVAMKLLGRLNWWFPGRSGEPARPERKTPPEIADARGKG